MLGGKRVFTAPIPIGWFPEVKRSADVEIFRRNLEFIRRETRLYEAGFWPWECPDCGRTVYARRESSLADRRAHKAWAHPVYKTRLQSIQETGRRPGRVKPWPELAAETVEKWWAGR